MASLLFDIGIVIIFATIIAYAARLLRQPLIVAYVIAGVLIGPLGLGLITNIDDIRTLAELGVAFLLFIVGLEIDVKKLRAVGAVTILGGTLQIIITFLIGFALAGGLGFDSVLSIYIGLLVAFSSTMIVTKLLIDRNEIQSLHGRIMIGILLLQDLAVILLLPLLTSITGGISYELVGETIVKGLGLFAIAIVLNRFIFPKLLDFAAGMREMLFLTAVSVVFVFIWVSSFLGFSIVIGAFIAGIALGNFPYKLEIVGETRSLMNFFSIIFFTSLGMSLSFVVIYNLFIPFILLLGLILIIKPLILAFLYLFMGYGTRTSSLIGIGLGQASEFSFIIAAQGLLLGQLTLQQYSLLISVVVVSMVLTPYLMKIRNRFHGIYSPIGRFLLKNKIHRNRKIRKMEAPPDELKGHVIVFGCDVMGNEVVKYLKRQRKRFVVVDHNPEKIRELKNRGIFCVYGNADHEDLLKRLRFPKARAIIITIPDDDASAFVIKKAKKLNKKIKIIARARYQEDAERLQRAGANIVVLPEYISGKRMVRELKKILKKG